MPRIWRGYNRDKCIWSRSRATAFVVGEVSLGAAYLDVSVADASRMAMLDGVQQLGKVISRRIVLEPVSKRGDEPYGVVRGAGGQRE